MNAEELRIIEIVNSVLNVFFRYIIPVFYAVATIGNAISAMIFFKKSWRKNVCVFYFRVSLLYSTFYINTVLLGSIFISGYQINLLNSSIFLCKFYFYTAFLSSTIYPSTLILASVDRLLISSQNVDTRLYSSKRLAYFLISISTAIWMIYFLHLIIMTNIQQFGYGFVQCYYDLSANYLQFVSYSSAVINGSFSVAMIILSIVASKNVRQIRARPRNQRQQQLRSMNKKDFQLLQCLYIQDILYIVFSLFISTVMVYNAASSNNQQTPIQNMLTNIGTMLIHVPFCSSFFIFVSASKNFRQEVKRIILKFIGKNTALPREEEEKPVQTQQNVLQVNVVSADHMPA